MNKSELINALSEKSGFSKKECDTFVKCFTETVTDALVSGDNVAIVGFGTFKTKERKARNVINPSTKEKIKVPAKIIPAFKAGKTLKESVDKPKSKKKKKG